mgnify:CR=1 FL=1
MHINIQSLVVEGVYPEEYPNFASAYFTYGEWANGEPLIPYELERISYLAVAMAREQISPEITNPGEV